VFAEKLGEKFFVLCFGKIVVSVIGIVAKSAIIIDIASSNG
jgi:hypothetical protein